MKKEGFSPSDFDVSGKQRMAVFISKLGAMHNEGFIFNQTEEQFDNLDKEIFGDTDNFKKLSSVFQLSYFKDQSFAKSIAKYYSEISDAFYPFGFRNGRLLARISPCSNFSSRSGFDDSPFQLVNLNVACFFASDLEVMNFTIPDKEDEKYLRFLVGKTSNPSYGSIQTKLAENRKLAMLDLFYTSIQSDYKFSIEEAGKLLDSLEDENDLGSGSEWKFFIDRVVKDTENSFSNYIDFVHHNRLSNTELSKILTSIKESQHILESYNKNYKTQFAKIIEPLEDYLEFWRDIVDKDPNLVENLDLETNIIEREVGKADKISGFNSTPFRDLITDLPAIITPNGLIYRDRQTKIGFNKEDSGSILMHKDYGPILALMNVDNEDVSNQGVVGDNPSLADYLKSIEDPPNDGNDKKPNTTITNDDVAVIDKVTAKDPPKIEPPQDIDPVPGSDKAGVDAIPKGDDGDIDRTSTEDPIDSQPGVSDRPRVPQDGDGRSSFQDPDDERPREIYADPITNNCL